MRAVGSEVGVDAVAGDDDRILFETPALRFFVSREKLQTRRVDRREVDLRLGRRCDGYFLRAAAAARDEQR